MALSVVFWRLETGDLRAGVQLIFRRCLLLLTWPRGSIHRDARVPISSSLSVTTSMTVACPLQGMYMLVGSVAMVHFLQRNHSTFQ